MDNKMREALNAIKWFEYNGFNGEPGSPKRAHFDKIKAALDQQGKQAPVGVVVPPPEDSDCNTAGLYASGLSLPVGTELYTHPQPAIPEGWKKVARFAEAYLTDIPYDGNEREEQCRDCYAQGMPVPHEDGCMYHTIKAMLATPEPPAGAAP